MPVRDWEKLRRQDKARKVYDPISSFRPRRSKGYAKKRMRRIEYRSKVADQEPVVQKCLRVEAPTFTAQAVFLRRGGRWRCIAADPAIDWFARTRNPETIQGWIKSKGYSYRWLPTISTGTNGPNKPSMSGGVP